MAEVVISSPAEREYAEALTWYAQRSVLAAVRFDAEFDRAVAAITAQPDRFPRCDDTHRYFLMHRFPYQIIYRQQGDFVTIIAVAHTSRRPMYWADR